MHRFATLFFSLALLVAPATYAQSMKGMDHGGMDMQGMKEEKAAAKTHRASGTVTRVDGSKVMIAHGPIETLKWPAMTMGFVAKDRDLLARLKQGAKIEFAFVEAGKDYIITEVK